MQYQSGRRRARGPRQLGEPGQPAAVDAGHMAANVRPAPARAAARHRARATRPGPRRWPGTWPKRRRCPAAARPRNGRCRACFGHRTRAVLLPVPASACADRRAPPPRRAARRARRGLPAPDRRRVPPAARRGCASPAVAGHVQWRPARAGPAGDARPARCAPWLSGRPGCRSARGSHRRRSSSTAPRRRVAHRCPGRAGARRGSARRRRGSGSGRRPRRSSRLRVRPPGASMPRRDRRGSGSPSRRPFRPAK